MIDIDCSIQPSLLAAFSYELHLSRLQATSPAVQRKPLIRPAEMADFEAWKVLWDNYNAFYGRSGESALSPKITSSTWQRFIDPDENVFCLLAMDSSNILGIAHYLFHRNTILIAPTCYVQDLFVAEKARGKGFARALMEEIFRRALEAGTASVYWHTHRSNKQARLLYDGIATDTDFTVYRRPIDQ